MSEVFNYINSSRLRAACEQGSVFATGVYVTNECSGNPIDITGYDVLMQVRLTPESATVVLEISTGNGYAVVSGPEGKISISVPSDITAALEPGVYVYDLDIIDLSSNSQRLIEGQFEITAEVSRA